ncbi:MAG: tetratricopeptide repeat protein, partial [Candidatus Zixiibacteriota bacterium]
MLVIFILLILCQFDSILFAGGNLRVAQLAQTDYIIHRWFEMGSSLLAASLYQLFTLLSVPANTAAVFAWNTLLWISILVSLAGSLILTGELTRRFEIRFWLFFIIFFGPHTLAFLGLMGPSITLVPVLIWFSLFAFRAMKNRSVPSLLMAWLVVATGVFFHYLSLFLIPAALYVTIQSTLKLKRWSVLAILSSLFSLAIVAGAFYYLGSTNLEFSGKFLLLEGKRPFVDYGLFSRAHSSDLIQIFSLAFPQILAVLFLLLTERRQGANFFLNGFSWTLFLSGLTAIFIVDPINNIALDQPRLVVFLVAAGILAASAVRLALDSPESSPRLPAIMAVMAIFLPLSIAPVYSRISVADKYIDNFLEENPDRFIPAGLAMRDAYFYKRDFDNANRWEQLLPVKSQDYLGFIGAGNLVLRSEFDGALEELYRLKTKYPAWIQPRFLLSEVQLHLRQFDRAKAEIDTLLMLEPFNIKHHSSLIKYYITNRNYTDALAATNEALDIFSDDKALLVDKLTALYGTGQFQHTDSLARELIRIDSNLADPYLFKGIVLERSGNRQLAVRDYEKFLKLAPDSPDAPEIRKRLNAI